MLLNITLNNITFKIKWRYYRHPYLYYRHYKPVSWHLAQTLKSACFEFYRQPNILIISH